jgi:hypothetical protein
MRPFSLSLGVLVIAGVLISCADRTAPTEMSVTPNFGVTGGGDCECSKDCALPGRMTGGGGSIDLNGAKVSKGLTLHCDITLSNNLEINWGGGNNFHITKPLISANCIDDPAVNPVPPAAPFDTFIGVAAGTVNGVEGYTAYFTFVDGGEPGTQDKAGIRIVAPDATVVLDVPLDFITNGNLQAHFDQPHGAHGP